MKTLVCSEPGKLEFKTTGNPELTEGMSIIKIKRIGICGTDLHAFEGTQPFFEYPRILAMNFRANWLLLMVLLVSTWAKELRLFPIFLVVNALPAAH